MFRLNELIATMAQSRTFFDDVKKELDCSVCQEQFSATKEPKILKCLHTFCRDCLETWLVRQREGKLSCPTCRQITECPNNDINRLPSNLFYKQLIDIVDAYSGGGVEDSPQCGNCEEKNYLKFYCSHCNCFLCEDCAGAHVKGKLFRGHQVKEVRNFQSSDVEDYARRANVCKKHDDEVRFFCVNCKICICRDCAVLEHQDHKKISIDEGLEINKSEIEAEMSEVQKNDSRLRTHRKALEKKRQKLISDIDGATREVKRVASCCVSLIRKHEENVLQQLVKQKEDLQHSFVAQTASLDDKLMEIESTVAFCEEVLLRKNLPEILNVKTIIEERLRDLSLSSPEDIPKQDYSRVKYVSNDFSFAPGKLITSNTEPLLSVAQGKGVTEGIVGHDCSFTVITKDSASKDTYSEIDEVQVAITSVSSQHDVAEPVNMTLKDGRYTFSYRPTTPGEFIVSIKVAGTPIMGSPFPLTVKSQPGPDYKIRTRDTLQSSEDCAICLDVLRNPRSLKCKHRFCSECLQKALDASNKCPVCQEPQGVLKGNQPRGEMTIQQGSYSLPGFEGCGTIIINYYFPPGIQGPEHPNPGQRYGGTARTAYLPDTRRGREVLQLLKRAFDARLVFTVGTSTTTGRSNQITWNDIHHKTCVSGGPTGFGYPDPDYLRRVKEELAAKGIR